MVEAGPPTGCHRASTLSLVIGCVVISAGVVQAGTIHPYEAASSGGERAAMQRVADDGFRRGPDSFADLAEKVRPAVIGITTRVRDRRGEAPPGQVSEFGEPPQSAPKEPTEENPQNAPDQDAPDRDQGTHDDEAPARMSPIITMGSGFFITPDGFAVTSNHVVENGDAAEIRTSDEETYPAKVVGRDPLSDLALIKVEAHRDFKYVKLAEQPPRVGDWVLTIGNAFGLGDSVTAGIVSARQRTIDASSGQDFLQIDAPINKGDSGGPTFDTNGDVIGVNSVIYSTTGGSVGVAFAIPADVVKTIIPQLMDGGAVTRGWLGVEVQTITPDVAESLGTKDLRGVIVASVDSGSPAAKAGVSAGDIITSLGGAPVRDAGELTRKVHATAPGSSVRLDTLKRGKSSPVNVTLSQLPNSPQPALPKR